jgi:hypothetical protein
MLRDGNEARKVLVVDKGRGGFKVKGLAAEDVGRRFELDYEGQTQQCEVRWADGEGVGLQLRF